MATKNWFELDYLVNVFILNNHTHKIFIIISQSTYLRSQKNIDLSLRIFHTCPHFTVSK